MFKKETKLNITKEINNEKPLKEVSDWREKNSYVAKELAFGKSKEVLGVINNLVDSRGDFSDFLSIENVEYFSEIFREIGKNVKVKNNIHNPDYNSRISGHADSDSDFGRVLLESLPIIFQKKVEQGDHKNSLSIIQAWAQNEVNLAGEEDRFSNAANAKVSFEQSLDDKKMSVLEKIYINYIGQQLNQTDAEELEMWLPEVYKEFKNEHPNIERFRKNVPENINLKLSPISRTFILMGKYCETSILSGENDWRNDHCESSLLLSRGEHKKIKPEIINSYDKENYLTASKILESFRNSEAGKLLPCREKIDSMKLSDTDGEYLVSDFSSEYDGIYSVSGNLEAFIKKGEINKNEEITANDFSEIKKEINFYDNKDIAYFKIMSSLFFRDALEKKCGIDIAKLNLRTQYQFLNFIKEYPEEKFKELKEFMDNSASSNLKEDRLKSFLCLELDKNLGDEIILLGKKLTPERADLFFSKVAAINDLACKEEAELGALLLEVNQNLDFSILKSELLKRARDLVIRFSTLTDDKLTEEESKNIFNELDNVKTEMVLFSSLLKTAKENNQHINLETVKDLNLRVKDYGEAISEKDKAEILKIARANWEGFGNEKMADVILEGLEDSLRNDKNQRAYILKYKNEIIGFVRFEKTDHGTEYAGSFNVSKDLRGLSIGSDLMEKVLIEEGKNNSLEATASVKTPIGCSFVEKVGFIADGFIENYHGTGEKVFSIKLDKLSGREFETRKNQNLEELKNKVSDYKNLNQSLNEPVIVLKFDFNSERNECEEVLSVLLAKTDNDLIKQEQPKYNLTRYFQDKTQPGDVRYLVFER